jgi:hypothetical protein
MLEVAKIAVECTDVQGEMKGRKEEGWVVREQTDVPLQCGLMYTHWGC